MRWISPPCVASISALPRIRSSVVERSTRTCSVTRRWFSSAEDSITAIRSADTVVVAARSTPLISSSLLRRTTSIARYPWAQTAIWVSRSWCFCRTGKRTSARNASARTGSPAVSASAMRRSTTPSRASVSTAYSCSLPMESHRRLRSVCNAALSRRSSSWPPRSEPTIRSRVPLAEAYFATWSRSRMPARQPGQQSAGPAPRGVARIEVLHRAAQFDERGPHPGRGVALAGGERADGAVQHPVGLLGGAADVALPERGDLADPGAEFGGAGVESGEAVDVLLGAPDHVGAHGLRDRDEPGGLLGADGATGAGGVSTSGVVGGSNGRRGSWGPAFRAPASWGMVAVSCAAGAGGGMEAGPSAGGGVVSRGPAVPSSAAPPRWARAPGARRSAAGRCRRCDPRSR